MLPGVEAPPPNGVFLLKGTTLKGIMLKRKNVSNNFFYKISLLTFVTDLT